MKFEWKIRSWNNSHRSKSYAAKSGKIIRRGLLLLLVVATLCVTWRSFKKRESIEDMMNRVRKEREADLERLLYYIQHPQTLCTTALSLGGRRDAKNRVDGDKVVCQDSGKPLVSPCLVYSFGGNDEWSFEEDIQKFGCKVYTFDPSLPMKHHQHKVNIWFYRIGISSYNINRLMPEERTVWRMRPLDDIMEALGHQNKQIDVLKLDIEGDEWNVLEDILNKGLIKKINHLCVEVHLHSMDWSRKLKILKRLEDASMKFFSSKKNKVTKPRTVPGSNRTEQLFYELAWFRDDPSK